MHFTKEMTILHLFSSSSCYFAFCSFSLSRARALSLALVRSFLFYVILLAFRFSLSFCLCLSLIFSLCVCVCVCENWFILGKNVTSNSNKLCMPLNTLLQTIRISNTKSHIYVYTHTHLQQEAYICAYKSNEISLATHDKL